MDTNIVSRPYANQMISTFGLYLAKIATILIFPVCIVGHVIGNGFVEFLICYNVYMHSKIIFIACST